MYVIKQLNFYLIKKSSKWNSQRIRKSIQTKHTIENFDFFIIKEMFHDYINNHSEKLDINFVENDLNWFTMRNLWVTLFQPKEKFIHLFNLNYGLGNQNFFRKGFNILDWVFYWKQTKTFSISFKKIIQLPAKRTHDIRFFLNDQYNWLNWNYTWLLMKIFNSKTLLTGVCVIQYFENIVLFQFQVYIENIFSFEKFYFIRTKNFLHPFLLTFHPFSCFFFL